jgi:protein-S-isoprenylcysteine O-methyltransferase Ste14
MTWLSRFAPLLFWIFFVGGLVGYRAKRFQRRFGTNPIRSPQATDLSAHAFLSRALLGYFVLLLTLSLVVAAAPGLLESMDPLYARRPPVLLNVGVLVATFAWFVVWRGQEDMAASWRIGIDESERTELVTRGLYRYCRHPIYVGLQLGMLAFWFLVPGYVSTLLVLVAVPLFQVQARLEEAFQHERHGASYARYCAEVGRFLPWTGRWSA